MCGSVYSDILLAYQLSRTFLVSSTRSRKLSVDTRHLVGQRRYLLNNHALGILYSDVYGKRTNTTWEGDNMLHFTYDGRLVCSVAESEDTGFLYLSECPSFPTTRQRDECCDRTFGRFNMSRTKGATVELFSIKARLFPIARPPRTLAGRAKRKTQPKTSLLPLRRQRPPKFI